MLREDGGFSSADQWLVLKCGLTTNNHRYAARVGRDLRVTPNSNRREQTLVFGMRANEEPDNRVGLGAHPYGPV